MVQAHACGYTNIRSRLTSAATETPGTEGAVAFIDPVWIFPARAGKLGAVNAEKVAPLGRKILVLDDNPIIQRTVYFALRDQGYQVTMVGEVSEAMKIMRREKMDLVLVDLSFPPDPATIGGRQQDGFYFIDWIHRTPEVAKPPLGIISSMDPALYRERAEHAGVRVCLQKPLDKVALVAAVRAVLGEG